jgi:multidrug efflux pump subunit AcrA (membrane-fusion protein)
MLLKLVLGGDVLGRHDYDVGQIQRARILKWYQQEGDWIEYGDDLLEVDVEAVQAPANKAELKHHIESLNASPSRIAELARRQLAGEAVSLGSIDPGVLEPRELGELTLTARICACDSGRLNRVYISEGERAIAGDILAVFTTEPDEEQTVVELVLRAAADFRGVANEVASAWDPEP